VSLAYKTTLEEQYFIDSEPKGEVISPKIDRLAAIFISKFKWAVKDFYKTFVNVIFYKHYVNLFK
jgi:hypothetical protein